MADLLAKLPKPETLLAYADILEKPQFWIDKNGNKFQLQSGEIIEAACTALRLAAKPTDDIARIKIQRDNALLDMERFMNEARDVRELKQRIHNLRVTLSSVVTLAESGPVNLKTQNAIAKAAKHSLDRDASTTGASKS